MATQDRLPTGLGTANQWAALGGGNKWEEVDDPVGSPDDATTYIFETDASGNQDFTFSAFSITSSAITKVMVTGRHSRTAAGEVDFFLRLRVNGVVYTSASMAPAETWTTDAKDWLTNPNTGAAWLEADVEGTGSAPLQEFGCRGSAIAGGEEVRLTQLYITVDYTAAGGETVTLDKWSVAPEHIQQATPAGVAY